MKTRFDWDLVLPEGKFQLEQNDSGEAVWKALCSDFESIVCRGMGRNMDYEIPEWHFWLKGVSAYLYNSKFYSKKLISDVRSLLLKHPGSFIRFECYDEKKPLGWILIFDDEVWFDELPAERKLSDRLL